MFTPLVFFIKKSDTVNNDIVNILCSLSHSKKMRVDIDNLKYYWFGKQFIVIRGKKNHIVDCIE